MNIQKYQFEGQEINIFDQKGEPWFLASEVCDVLEIANPRDAVSTLDDDEKDVVITDTLGGQQARNVISESGLYSLVLRSRKPEAKRFKKWVTSEVLPQIRKTGGYCPEVPRELQLAQAMLMAGQVIEEQRQRLALSEPKVKAHDRFMQAENTQTVRQVGKLFGLGDKTLFRLMRECRILMKNNLPYQHHIDAGRFKVIQKPFHLGDEIKLYLQTVFTAKGIDWISTVIDELKAEAVS